jgi:hypothetical protein
LFLLSILGLTALPFLSLPTHADDGFQVKVLKGQHADIIRPDGDPILRYMYQRDTSSPERSFDTAKVFAHVMAPGGKNTLTKGAGGKFPHHRGIFIGWNRIQYNGKRHDLWHVRNTEQAHRGFLTTQGGPDGGTITSRIAWIGVDGETLIEEKRTYRVVAAKDAYAVIDFVSELTAKAGPLELNGDPEHAGVQFRPSQQVADNKSATYTFHQPGIDPKKQRGLPWVANTFRVDDQTWTVQHMSHPSNPEDAIWSAYRDYGRFGPFSVIELAQGDTLTLRYRFRVTEGEAPSRDAMSKHYAAFAE